MTDFESPLMTQWIDLEMALHRFHDINFKKMGPMGAPQRGQGKLMCIIREHPNITQKELCENSGMRQQSVSELLKKLENNNFISRTPSPDDKRISLFNLTEEGKRFPAPPKEAVKSFNYFFSCLNGEEQKTMAEYLQRIRQNIEHAIDCETKCANNKSN